MELLPTIRKSIIAFVLLPALLYAGIPPTLQSDASQRMTKDIMNRAYITPKRIVTKYAGCKNNLIKDEHYLLERGNGQSEMNRFSETYPYQRRLPTAGTAHDEL